MWSLTFPIFTISTTLIAKPGLNFYYIHYVMTLPELVNIQTYVSIPSISHSMSMHSQYQQVQELVIVLIKPWEHLFLPAILHLQYLFYDTPDIGCLLFYQSCYTQCQQGQRLSPKKTSLAAKKRPAVSSLIRRIPTQRYRRPRDFRGERRKF